MAFLLGLSLFFLNSLSAQVVPNDSLPKGKQGIKGGESQQENLAADTIPQAPSKSEGKAAITEQAGKGEVGPVRKQKKASGIDDKSPKLRREVYDPNVALRRSLILPGWGQLYNHRWWKVPIIYGGFGAFTYFFLYNHEVYKEMDAAVKCKADTSCIDLYPGFGISQIINIREDFRRNRDFNVIMGVLWYTLNGIEAYIDAHLRGFDVSDDLSLHIKPNLMIDPMRQQSVFLGANIALRLR